MKVGDYVRTKEGEIGKITEIDGLRISADFGGYIGDSIADHYKKSSPNIIDLIEVGDYVNGVLVEEIYQREEDKLYIHTFDTEIMLCYTNSNIETIVTHEQFESMEYRIGE